MSDELRATIAATSRPSELRMLAEQALDQARAAEAERDRAVAVIDAAQELMLCIDSRQRVWAGDLSLSALTEIVALRAALAALAVNDRSTTFQKLLEFERGRADGYKWQRDQLRIALTEAQGPAPPAAEDAHDQLGTDREGP